MFKRLFYLSLIFAAPAFLSHIPLVIKCLSRGMCLAAIFCVLVHSKHYAYPTFDVARKVVCRIPNEIKLLFVKRHDQVYSSVLMVYLS